MRLRFKDREDERYGKLTALYPLRVKNREGIIWWCVCDCGSKLLVSSRALGNGDRKSCGCFDRSLYRKTHGMFGTRSYKCWHNMKQRCNNPNNTCYHRYGARGITYEDRWESFENFYEDMGDCPEGLTLERLDNDLDYSKDNCSWVSRHVQSRNTSRTIKVTLEGRTQCLKDWCRELGVSYEGVRRKVASGMKPEEALTK